MRIVMKTWGLLFCLCSSDGQLEDTPYAIPKRCDPKKKS